MPTCPLTYFSIHPSSPSTCQSVCLSTGLRTSLLSVCTRLPTLSIYPSPYFPTISISISSVSVYLLPISSFLSISAIYLLSYCLLTHVSPLSACPSIFLPVGPSIICACLPICAPARLSLHLPSASLSHIYVYAYPLYLPIYLSSLLPICLSVYRLHLPVCLPAYLSSKEMAIHSSALAWKIPWMEEPDGLQSLGSQRVGHA